MRGAFRKRLVWLSTTAQAIVSATQPMSTWCFQSNRSRCCLFVPLILQLQLQSKSNNKAPYQNASVPVSILLPLLPLLGAIYAMGMRAWGSCSMFHRHQPTATALGIIDVSSPCICIHLCFIIIMLLPCEYVFCFFFYWWVCFM